MGSCPVRLDLASYRTYGVAFSRLNNPGNVVPYKTEVVAMATHQGAAKNGDVVVPLERPQKAKSTSNKKASAKKWGEGVMQLGFCIVPSILLKAQRRLGLNSTQLVVLLQLIDYWWTYDNNPFPSKQTLSDRLGLGPRQIQRYMAELEKAGLVTRIERRGGHNGKLSNEYDLAGLVARLKKLAPEFEEANERRRQVTQPGGLRKKAAAKE